jgi:4'-phosphopantetheinyl transferase
MIDFLWKQPPADPILADNDVHVWCAALDQPPERMLQLALTLSTDEAKRAERFVFDRDRHHFIAGRGILRTILGHYLQVSPEHLRFKYGPQGKPELETNGESNLRFNLSHSGGVVLYGLTYRREIGVDIEAIRPLEDMEQIAKRFFSPTEYADLRSLPANQQHQAFFNCWTRKEAYIKAIGDGLRYPLDKFVVSLAPGKPARLLHIQADPQALAHWSLTELNPAPGYSAALVVGGHNWWLAGWQWPDSAH